MKKLAGTEQDTKPSQQRDENTPTSLQADIRALFLPVNDTWNGGGDGNSLERAVEDVLVGGPDLRARDVAARRGAARDRQHEEAILNVDVFRRERASVRVCRLADGVCGDTDVVLREELGDGEVRRGVRREVHGERLSHSTREKESSSGNKKLQEHSDEVFKYQSNEWQR